MVDIIMFIKESLLNFMVVYNGYGWRVIFDYSFLYIVWFVEVGYNEFY